MQFSKVFRVHQGFFKQSTSDLYRNSQVLSAGLAFSCCVLHAHFTLETSCNSLKCSLHKQQRQLKGGRIFICPSDMWAKGPARAPAPNWGNRVAAPYDMQYQKQLKAVPDPTKK